MTERLSEEARGLSGRRGEVAERTSPFRRLRRTQVRAPAAEVRPFRVEIPQTDLDDLRDATRPRALARRATRRRLELRRSARLRPRAGRRLAHGLRLALARGEAERLSAVHDDHRRAAGALRPRALARARCAAADLHARLADVGLRVPRPCRAAERSARPRRRSG